MTHRLNVLNIHLWLILQKPMEPEPGVDVEAGAVVVGAVAVAGKEIINPTKYNWKNGCEFSKEHLVFAINKVNFCQ